MLSWKPNALGNQDLPGEVLGDAADLLQGLVDRHAMSPRAKSTSWTEVGPIISPFIFFVLLATGRD